MRQRELRSISLGAGLVPCDGGRARGYAVKRVGYVESYWVFGMVVCIMLLAGCATTSAPNEADPAKMQFLRVDTGLQAFGHKYSYTGSSADVRVYESNQNVFVFVWDREDARRQKIHKLISGQALEFQPTSPTKITASVDDLMRSLNAKLVFKGELIPGQSVYHGLARELGVEYYLRPYRIGNQGGQISVEYVLYSDMIQKAKNAMVARDVGLLSAQSKGRGLPFFLADFTEKQADLVTNLDDLSRLERVVEKFGVEDKSLLCFIERRRLEIRFLDLSISAATASELQQLRAMQGQAVPGCLIPQKPNIDIYNPIGPDRVIDGIKDRKVIRAYNDKEPQRYVFPDLLNKESQKLGASHWMVDAPNSETLKGTINVGVIRRSDAAPMMPRLAGTTALASSEKRVAAILDVAEKKAHAEKIVSLRAQKTFRGYWDAYQLTQAPADIKSAYMAASTDREKMLAEKGIVMALPPSRIFDIKIAGRKDTPLRTGRSSGIFQSTKAQVKDISRRVVVTIRKDIPFAVRHADYSITLKFKEMLEFEPPIKGREEDFVEKSLKFDLRKNNGWRSEQELVFEGIPVSGTVRPGGVKALSFMSGLFGGPRLNEGDLDINFKLQGSVLKYEMEGLK